MWNSAYSLFCPRLTSWGNQQSIRMKPYAGFSAVSVKIPEAFSDCCGAKQTSGWFHNFNAGAAALNKGISVERLKQDFLYTLVNYLGDGVMTMYTIATNAQINTFPAGPLALVLECGAKVVDSMPNMNHKGNEMCMIRWCPTVHGGEALEKYLTKTTKYGWLPKWWADMPEDQQNEYKQSAEAQALVAFEDVLHKEGITRTEQNKLSSMRSVVYNLAYDANLRDKAVRIAVDYGLNLHFPSPDDVQRQKREQRELEELRKEVELLKSSKKVVTKSKAQVQA